ncbi:transposase [Streptomyces achromogenes]|uniref:transposase n=1 Tax=Streptomyces achromogenes TaxID=67255 RepID=UPI0036B3F557
MCSRQSKRLPTSIDQGVTCEVRYPVRILREFEGHTGHSPHSNRSVFSFQKYCTHSSKCTVNLAVAHAAFGVGDRPGSSGVLHPRLRPLGGRGDGACGRRAGGLPYLHEVSQGLRRRPAAAASGAARLRAGHGTFVPSPRRTSRTRATARAWPRHRRPTRYAVRGADVRHPPAPRCHGAVELPVRHPRLPGPLPGRHPTGEAGARPELPLPRGKKPGRPPIWTRRQLIDGIRRRTRAGTPWRDVPERYGPWGRVYGLLRRWRRDGIRQRIFTRLQAQADAKDLITRDIDVDSTIRRTHQHAAGTRKGGIRRGKGESAEGTARRDRHRAGRSRSRTLARWPDHQAPLGRRAGPEACVDRHHGRTARELRAVRPRPEGGLSASHEAGPAPHPTRPRLGSHGGRPRVAVTRIVARRGRQLMESPAFRG